MPHPFSAQWKVSYHLFMGFCKTVQSFLHAPVLNPEATVEVLYPAKAEVGEGPFYEEETDTLLWVDILSHTINFYSLKTNQNRLAWNCTPHPLSLQTM